MIYLRNCTVSAIQARSTWIVGVLVVLDADVRVEEQVDGDVGVEAPVDVAHYGKIVKVAAQGHKQLLSFDFVPETKFF